MTLETLLASEMARPPLVIAAALALGALHGLEPGHAKTLMAAFIVAVRGTAWQAVLLGVSVAASHTLVVWMLALAGLGYGGNFLTDDNRPYLVTAAGVIIVCVGVGSALRSWAAMRAARGDRGGHHHRTHADDHHHDHPHPHDDGGRHADSAGDAHQQAHAAELRHRFSGGRATTGQIIVFGITGGLVPCSAAVAVLLICLQQQKILLGVGLVGAFTAGLALMLVGVGVLAASGAALAARSSQMQRVMRLAPPASAVILTAIGAGMLDEGLVLLGL